MSIKVGAHARPSALLSDDDFDRDSDGDDDGLAASGKLGEDPRTLSQIRRSRVDLAKRYVFLCPTSLSKHFDSLPHQAKDSALLVFRCSRKWIFGDSVHVNLGRLRAKVESGPVSRRRATDDTSMGGGRASIATALYRREHSMDFLQWIRTKEKEGCVFWFKPERDLEKMSKFFEEKIDPVNERPYRPLLLDAQWWRTRFQRPSARYIGSPVVVVSALTADARRRCGSSGPAAKAPLLQTSPPPLKHTMTSLSVVSSFSCYPEVEDVRSTDIDIPALQELIFQSNPTLEPISKWPHAPSMRFLPRVPKMKVAYANQENSVKGLISFFHRSPCGGSDTSRLEHWPSEARDRFDNLHSLWEHEEAAAQRRVWFSSTAAPPRASSRGTSSLLLPAMPLSAR